MYRSPARPPQPHRSPGAPRPDARFPSPAPGWASPGAWSSSSPAPGWASPGARSSSSPYGGSGGGGYRGAPSPAWSTGSPAGSPGSNRGYRDGFGFGFESRGFGGQMRRRGNGFRRPQSFSPGGSAQKFQADPPVEKYFSPSMLQDPWAALQPIRAADADAARRTS